MDLDSTETRLGIGQWTVNPQPILDSIAAEYRDEFRRVNMRIDGLVTRVQIQSRTVENLLNTVEHLLGIRNDHEARMSDLYPDVEHLGPKQVGDVITAENTVAWEE
jgi:hypothetical protein